MCEILTEQYISSYSKPREESELTGAENQADEHSPSLNDIDFTENDLITASKELQVQTKDLRTPQALGVNLSTPLSIMWRDSLRTEVIPTYPSEG